VINRNRHKNVNVSSSPLWLVNGLFFASLIFAPAEVRAELVFKSSFSQRAQFRMVRMEWPLTRLVAIYSPSTVKVAAYMS
jgi:hypothetical protein